MSKINVGKVSPVPKGYWDNTTTYQKLNMVNYKGVLYIAKQDVPANKEPTNSDNTEYWMQATNKWDITVTGINDSTADATGTFNSGNGTNIINFTIPRGAFDTEIIDDNAGSEDTTHVWSANQNISILKTATGIEPINNWEAGYITTRNDTVDVNIISGVSGGVWKHAIIPCTAEDIFIINGTGGIGPRLWAFINNENTVIERSDVSITENNLKLKAPQNSAYLIINNNNKNAQSYKGGIFIDNVNNENSNIILSANKTYEELNNLKNVTITPYLETINSAQKLSNATNGTYSANDFLMNKIICVTQTGLGLLDYPSELGCGIGVYITYNSVNNSPDQAVQIYINDGALATRRKKSTGWSNWLSYSGLNWGKITGTITEQTDLKNILDTINMGSGLRLDTNEMITPPYDDLNTIPTNKVILYGPSVTPLNVPSGAIGKYFGIIGLSRSKNNEYSAITTQLLFAIPSNITSDDLYIYSRISMGGINDMQWTEWTKIINNNYIEKICDDLTSGYGSNSISIERNGTTTIRGIVVNSIAEDNSLIYNGVAIDVNYAYRCYTTNKNVGDVNLKKIFTLEKGKTYLLGYKYISGSGEGDAYCLGVYNNTVGICGLYPRNYDLYKTFTAPNDMEVEIRVNINHNANYSNYKIIPYLKLLVDNPVKITPSVFTKIAAVGDSFVAGVSDEDGVNYVYSWLNMMAREYGCEGHNFSRGGLTTRTWLTNSYGKASLEQDVACDLYFIALGINDSNPDYRNVPLGNISDMDEDEPPDTFYGNMKKIRDIILTKKPNAVLCYITPMRLGDRYTPYADAVIAIAEKYGCLYIDWRDVKYATSDWWSDNLVSAHPTPVMYNAMMHSIVELLSNAIENNMSYIAPYPNIVNL